MSRLRKLAYSFGNLGASLSYQAVSTYVQFFYLDVMKLAPPLMGGAMVVYAIWNSINDPIAGHISDRTRTRWGRRIPYVMFLSFPLVVLFALVWFVPPPAVQDQIFLLTYFLFVLLLFDGLHTIVSLNMTALFPEMYPGLEERAEVSAYRQVFALLGSIVGIALPPIVYSTIGWGSMGILFGAVAAVSLYVSLRGMQERGHMESETDIPLRQALVATFRNRSFVTYLAFQVMLQFSFLLIMATVPFYAKYVLKAEESVTSVLLFAAFAVAFPLVFFWSWLATRLGTRNAMMLALVVFGATLVPFLFVADFVSTLLTTSSLGIGLAGLVVLPDILLSDVIDEDEQKTGARREGMYFGMQGLLIRAGIVLQALALNMILSATGYNPSLAVADQPPALEMGLRLALSLVPIAAVGLALLSLFAYPLHGQRLSDSKARRAQPSTGAVA